MKSKTNKTGYDDTLFFRCIPNAIKTLFILPVNAPFFIKNRAPESSIYEISAVKIQTEHCRPVYNSANGTVLSVLNETDAITGRKVKKVIIKHPCSLYSKYENLADCSLKVGASIPQGQQIAQTGKDKDSYSITFSLLIDINEILLTPTDTGKQE